MVLLLLADDIGYNDVSWHNSKIIMPNLDSLARSGLILENTYAQSVCLHSIKSCFDDGILPNPYWVSNNMLYTISISIVWPEF